MLDFWRWFPADGQPPRQGWWLVPLALWAALALPVGIARAQWAVDGFDPGADGEVNAVAVQRDGKIVVAGSFSMLGGAPHNYIGRLNADGSPDSSFTLGTDSFVEALAVQADGKIVVGGEFSMLGGAPRNSIGRLDADGSLDTTFDPGTDEFAIFWIFAVQADGKIVVAGSFNMLGGVARDNIGRLNADGSVDTSFDPGANGQVLALALQTDGKIVVGGQFSTLGGEERFGIGRLNTDGSLDTSFSPEVSLLGNTCPQVGTLAVQADGKILIGGGFNMLDGTTHNEIGRVNVDGSADTSFNAGTNIGVNTDVGAIAAQADGKIVVAGSFNVLGGVARDNIGRLNADGSVDTSFDLGANGPVLALALQTDGKIVVGGTFSMLGGAARNAIGRLSAAPQQSIAGDNDGCQTTATLPGANTWLIFVPMAALVWLRPRHR